jgi:serine/threonine-protein kinase RsbW
MAQYEFTYPSTHQAADQVLDNLLRIMQEHEVDEEVVRPLTLAVSEAFTNAVVHGNRENPGLMVTVTLLVNENQISADIIDEGRGGVKKIESRRPSTELDEGGRGVDLIRYYADASEFREVNGGGLKVSITFQRTKTKIV